MIIMTSGIITGLIALLGVVIGAAGAFGASWMTARTQRLQVAAGRDERQNDVRREACVAFLTHASGFLDRARELAVALDSGAAAGSYDDLHQRYLSEWHELVRTCAAVEIAGPASVADAAKAMRAATGEVADVCDNWHRARLREGPVNARWAAYRTAQATAETASDAFVHEAQEWWRDPYVATKITRQRGADQEGE
jgi:hypothetical protein